MATTFTFQKPLVVVLTMATALALVVTQRTLAQSAAKVSPLIVRVAVFTPDQSRPDDYQDFVEGHLFPTVRTVPGYVGTFLGKETKNGAMISVSFWRSEADAVAGEEAVGRTIRALPSGSAPRPSKVDKYVIVFRDVNDAFPK
jgi:hypothetical protein